MAITQDSATIDGVNGLSLFGNYFDWYPANNSLVISPWGLDNPDGFSAEIGLEGEWYLNSLSFFRNEFDQELQVTIDDGTDGGWIGFLELYNVGGDIVLDSIDVSYLHGGNRQIKLTLGSGYYHAINIWDDEEAPDTYSGHSITLTDGDTHSISTGDKDDTLTGANGNNAGGASVVMLGDGDNRVDGRNSSFGILEAGNGDDTVTLNAWSRSVDLGDGDNLFTLGAGGEIGSSLHAGDDDDTLILETEAEILSAVLDDGRNTVTLGADARIEHLRLGEDGDTVRLGAGARIDHLESFDGNDRLTLDGGARIDTAETGAGNDTVRAGEGARIDYLALGEGNDRLVVENGARLRQVTGWAEDGGGTNGNHTVILQGDGIDGNDTARIASLNLDAGNDSVTLTGDARINWMSLYTGTNTLVTGSGWLGTIQAEGRNTFDIGTGGAGWIDIYGDPGAGRSQTIATEGWIDRLVVSEVHSAAVTVEDGGGIDSLRLKGLRDRLTVERGGHVGDADLGGGNDAVLVKDGSDAEILRTRTGADRIELRGDADADWIAAGLGNDLVRLIGRGEVGTLDTSSGNDTVVVNRTEVGVAYLGAGDDLLKMTNMGGSSIFLGGEGVDTADLSALRFSADIDLGSLGYVTQSNGARVRINGFENLVGTGNADTLAGNADDNRILGRNGADHVSGGGGHDTLDGGLGWDTLDGGAGRDVLRGSAGRDVLIGSTGFDFLDGGIHNDRLEGGGNGDTLVGGDGNDTLTGDGGFDEFVFDADDGSDILTDFTLGWDRIAFEGATGLGDIGFAAAGGGSDTELSFGATSVLVEGVAVADLQESANFVF
ncbi:calcium-binding protein [Mangrovicoccus ximenensis]|uniref:calcium-binding protein n=1 Tax=Mangrovicoccus ximenensis TaxID=1911570 RepID=UPI000D3DA7A4|nr:calcium-binding protein [Mangrovicoccus ximenensis]